ncbi:MAG TPA: phosphate acyltransferase [Candidatus Nanoarchaeia archaeon]|nr:phosphate acyltransferase [Candidatus Nanoarchaeia archaeon]
MSLNFTEFLRAKARRDPKKVVFPEASEERILRAARQCRDLNVAYPILIGKPDDIFSRAQALGISLSGISIVDHTDETLATEYVAQYRAANAVLPEKTLKRMLRQPLNFAVLMEAVGEVDCTVAGLSHTTGEVILAAQTIIGMHHGIETISSVAFNSIPGYDGPEKDLLVLADCAVCPDPTPSELADIAISSADTTRCLLDIEPRIALLSFSTKGSAMHEKVDRVLEALEIVHRRRPDVLIDGELQLDSAIDPRVASRKIKDLGGVAGRANVLVFPDLNAGNIGVKLLQIFGKALSYGPLLQGFAKPITDLSRGAKVEDIVGAATNVVVLAQTEVAVATNTWSTARG